MIDLSPDSQAIRRIVGNLAGMVVKSANLEFSDPSETITEIRLHFEGGGELAVFSVAGIECNIPAPKETP